MSTSIQPKGHWPIKNITLVKDYALGAPDAYLELHLQIQVKEKLMPALVAALQKRDFEQAFQVLDKGGALSHEKGDPHQRSAYLMAQAALEALAQEAQA